jgi:hypothetical protein
MQFASSSFEIVKESSRSNTKEDPNNKWGTVLHKACYDGKQDLVIKMTDDPTINLNQFNKQLQSSNISLFNRQNTIAFRFQSWSYGNHAIID